jgi:hypothetical protein
MNAQIVPLPVQLDVRLPAGLVTAARRDGLRDGAASHSSGSVGGQSQRAALPEQVSANADQQRSCEIGTTRRLLNFFWRESGAGNQDCGGESDYKAIEGR